MGSKYACPHCGSENTISIPLAYQNGHSVGSTTNREIIGTTSVDTHVSVNSDGSTSTHTTGGEAIYGNVTRTVESYSDLAKTIPPPVMPELHKKELQLGDGCVVNLFLFLAFCVLCSIVGSILNPLREILLKLLDSWLIVDGIGLILIPMLTVMLMVMFAHMAKKFYNNYYKDENIKLQERFDREMIDYVHAWLDWQNGYICMRCGNKFIVHEIDESAPAEEK